AHYLVQCMQYVWLNRFKVGGLRPDRDAFCSASWRLHGKSIIHSLVSSDKDRALFERLLNRYPEVLRTKESGVRKFVRDRLTAAMSKLAKYDNKIFTNGHTIGDPDTVKKRQEFFTAFRRDHVPWIPYWLT